MAKIQLRARAQIHLTKKPGSPGDKAKGIAPTPPEVVIVQPGSMFMVDESLKDFYTKGVKPAAELVVAPEVEPEIVDVEDAVKATRKATGTSRQTRAKPEPKAATKAATKAKADEGGEGGQNDLV